MTRKQWEIILQEMEYHFLEANEETCSKQIDYGNSDSNISDMEKWTEIVKYREEHLNKGLEMFVKYFNELWD